MHVVYDAQGQHIKKALLENPHHRVGLIEEKQKFGAMAIANKREEADGFSQMYVHQFVPRKTSPGNHVWSSIDADYHALFSTGNGSLFDLLTTLLLNGFRIFPKAAETIQEKISNHMAQYDKIVAIEPVFEGLDISVASIYNGLTGAFRGKGVNIGEAALTQRLSLILTGKTAISDKNEMLTSRVANTVTELMNNFDTYRELNTAPDDAIKLFAKGLGLTSQTTTALVDGVGTIQELGNSIQKDYQKATICYAPCYDPSLPLYDKSDLPHTRIIKLVALYSYYAEKNGQKAPKACLEHITTTNANGLSWFFSKGLALLKKESMAQLSEGLGVGQSESQQTALKNLVGVARDIEISENFGPSVLKDARVAVQGMIDSTISNFFARNKPTLSQLEAMDLSDNELSIAALEELEESWFQQVGYDKQQVIHAIGLVSASQETHLPSIRVLFGLGDKPSKEKIENAVNAYEEIRTTIGFVLGAYRAVNQKLKRSGHSTLAMPAITMPVRLPWISPPVSSIAADRKELLQQFQALSNEYAQLVEDVICHYRLSFDVALEHKTTELKAACQSTKRTALKDPKVVASRYYLSRIFNAVYKCSHELRCELYTLCVKLDLVVSKQEQRELHEHLFTRKHYCFVSPYDNGVKRLLKICDQALLKLDAIALLDALVEHAQNRHDRHEILHLQMTRSQILFDGIETIDTRLVTTTTMVERAPDHLRHYLTEETIPGGAASSLINSTYQSVLTGINYRLNKEKFKHNITFKNLQGNRLVYVPKSPWWKPHETFWDNPNSSLLEMGLVIEGDQGINVIETLNTFASTVVEPHHKKQIMWLLEQMPHSWYMDLGVKGWGIPNKMGIQVNQGDLSKVKEYSSLVPIRHGKRSSKLAKALHELFDGGKSSPPTLTFSRSFNLIADEVVEDRSQRSVIINLPIKQVVSVEEETWSPTYILGIDPAEKGLGIGVVDLQGNVIDSAFIRTRYLKEFIKIKNEHITKVQPRQQYKAPYSQHLEKAKERAVGEIANVIDNLMLQLNSCPVIEIPDLKGPALQVWESVASLYKWGDNDAQNARRIRHWRGASRWITSLASTTGEPVKLFPGTVIGSYGNSHVCPECKRNAVEDVKAEFDKSRQLFSIVDGRLLTHSGELYLEQPCAATLQERKGKGMYPEYIPVNREIEKATKTNQQGKELLMLLRRSIRRGTTYRNSELSISSQFHCPYLDCGHHTNSDAAAGIAIARKFLKKLA